MKPILEDLDGAVERLEAALEKSDAKMGTRMMVNEELRNVRRLRDRVRNIVEEE